MVRMQRAEWGSLEMKNKCKTCGIGLDSDGLGPFFSKCSAPQPGPWSRQSLGRRVSGRASREGTEEKKEKTVMESLKSRRTPAPQVQTAFPLAP